ncbi:MAG: addiction module toxin RelE [Epulopiscium sp. Nele67-Bin004]|nr:MAG: addiction module toxin RelE [Epulopiscium sp. Nele67-Bin004]
MKYIVKNTTRFKKDYKQAVKQNKDMKLLNTVVEMLANGETLPEKYKDHELKGNWKGHRECHIAPDWLLVYYVENEILVLTLSRLGSHSELF